MVWYLVPVPAGTCWYHIECRAIHTIIGLDLTIHIIIICAAKMVLSRSIASCARKSNLVSQNLNAVSITRCTGNICFTTSSKKAKDLSTPEDDKKSKETAKSIYFWGTTAKGTIPTKEVLAVGREDIGGNEDTGIMNLDRFRSGSTVIDVPTEIDLKDAFGIGGESDETKSLCRRKSIEIVLCLCFLSFSCN